MSTATPDITQKPLLAWIFTGNRWLQVALILAALLAVLANILPLEMQKRIVNEAINLSEFDLLVSYCGIYLAAVVIASSLKYLISALQSVIAQRTTARMRKELYRHILTLPLSFYREIQPGLPVTALITELATAGDFIGMAVAVPATNLLMAAAFAGYLIWLNPLLALISFSIYPVVLLLVPMLQKKANRYNKKRVDAGRLAAGKIGESVAGVHEIQANSAFEIENEKFGGLVDRLRRIRIVWNLYRQAIKRLNGLFTNFSRFLIFAVGGYLAINGRLELGALVAFLSAQEKLYSPWKELIQFYQAYQTSSVTYRRTMDRFDLKPEHALASADREPYRLAGNIKAEGLSYETEDGTRLLSDIDFELDQGDQMALVGYSGSGKSTLAQCLVQLYRYSRGKLQLDGREVSEMTKKDIACNTGFVSQTPFIFAGTIEENLLYGHRSLDKAGRQNRSIALDDKILVLQQTGLFLDVLGFGLNAVLDPENDFETAERILQVRQNFQETARAQLEDILDIYEPDRYQNSSSIAENLLFVDALRAPHSTGQLAAAESFRSLLDKLEITGSILELGMELALEEIRIFSNRSLQDRPSAADLIQPGEMDAYQKTVDRLRDRGFDRICSKDRQNLIRVALDFIPDKHKAVKMPDGLKKKIVAGRRAFRSFRCEGSETDTEICKQSDYLFSQSILTNILYGKLKDESSRSRQRIYTIIHQHLVKSGLLEEILEMGLQYEVGIKGANLSGGQRQKLAIARVFLKDPSVLIMDEATSGLDNDSQSRIQQIIESKWKGKSTVISVAHRLDTIKTYDHIAVMKGGEIVEMGGYDELIEQEGTLFKLVQSERGLDEP